MANISDKFNKVSNDTGLYPVVATVTAPRATGDTILTCDSLAGWATDTAVHFSTYALNADGLVDKTTQTDWKGTVVNNTITNIERKAGRDDFGNIAGDKVELLPTGAWANDLMDGLLTAHDQNGQLKDGSVTSSKIASNSISEAKIAPLSVTTGKIANSAITEEKIANGAVKSDKIDWSTVPLVTGTFSQTGEIVFNSTMQNFATMTITTPGVYLVKLGFDINAYGNYLNNAHVGIKVADTYVVDRYFNNSGRDYFQGGFDIATIVAVTNANTQIVAFGNSAQASWGIPTGASRREFKAVRIA